jgi:nitroimidazol reductase NimA-like FMN-containing flavoprotein (pyridoxamine 5'-phosphate oxidase superfamily)
MPQRTIVELSEDECYALLGDQGVGRLIFVDDLGPAGLPVNYAIDGKNVVFRREGTHEHVLHQKVAFQVDQIDPSSRAGWSVLLRGTVQEVDIEAAAEMLHRLSRHFPAPWATGVHNQWVVFVPEVVTGRRLTDAVFTPLY